MARLLLLSVRSVRSQKERISQPEHCRSLQFELCQKWEIYPRPLTTIHWIHCALNNPCLTFPEPKSSIKWLCDATVRISDTGGGSLEVDGDGQQQQLGLGTRGVNFGQSTFWPKIGSPWLGWEKELDKWFLRWAIMTCWQSTKRSIICWSVCFAKGEWGREWWDWCQEEEKGKSVGAHPPRYWIPTRPCLSLIAGLLIRTNFNDNQPVWHDQLLAFVGSMCVFFDGCQSRHIRGSGRRSGGCGARGRPRCWRSPSSGTPPWLGSPSLQTPW